MIVEWLNMSNQISNTSSLLNSRKFIFKPLHVVSRILTHAKDPPVLSVHGLSIKSNDSGSRSNKLSIRKLKVSDEVTIFSKFINCVLSDPIDPGVFESIDVCVTVGGLKVFYVDRPSVVISLNRVNSNRAILESVFNHLSNLKSVVRHLFRSVHVSIVRRVITSPEHKVRLYYVTHMFEHVLQSNLRKVTLVSTPLSSLFCDISWEPINCSAAEIAPTVVVSTNFIFHIDVRIRHMNYLESLSRFSICLHLVVKVVNEVIIFDAFRLVR